MKTVKICPKCEHINDKSAMSCEKCHLSLVTVEPVIMPEEKKEAPAIQVTGDLWPGEAEMSTPPEAQTPPPPPPAAEQKVRGNGDLLPGEAEKTSKLKEEQWKELLLYEVESNRQIVIAEDGMVGRQYPPFAADQQKYDTISRHHCDLKLLNGELHIRDTGSTNGTKVNGRVIEPHKWIKLTSGDLLELADHRFKVN